MRQIQKQPKVSTVKPVFKPTWEIGRTWELRTATSVPRPIQYIEMDLRNKTTSKFRRVIFHSLLGVPNSQVCLYMYCLFKVNIGSSVLTLASAAINIEGSTYISRAPLWFPAEFAWLVIDYTSSTWNVLYMTTVQRENGCPHSRNTLIFWW